MAHNNRTPRSVLDAPVLTPVRVYRSSPTFTKSGRVIKASEPFRGNVQADLLGSTRPAQLAARRQRHVARYIRKVMRERSRAFASAEVNRLVGTAAAVRVTMGDTDITDSIIPGSVRVS